MKKKILALACAVACVSVFTAVFAACSGDGGGTEVEVQCSGPDEEAALLEAVRLIENGLGE